MKSGKRALALILSLCVVLCGLGMNFSVFAADPVVNVSFNPMDSADNQDMEPANDLDIKDMTVHKADFLQGTAAVKFAYKQDRKDVVWYFRATGSHEADSGSDYVNGVNIAGATHMIFDLYVSDVSKLTLSTAQQVGLRGLESSGNTGNWESTECGVIQAAALSEAFSNLRNGWNQIELPLDRSLATSDKFWGCRIRFVTGIAKAGFYTMVDDIRFVNQAYLNSADYTNAKAQKKVNRVSNILTYLTNNGFNSASPTVEHRRLMVEANVEYHGLTSAQQGQVANKSTLYTAAATAIPSADLATRASVKKGDYAFSLAVLSDLHYAVRKMASWQNVYRNSMQWIINNQEKENILMALQLGDLTSNVDYSAGQNEIPEWNAVRSGYDMLRAANIPFSTVIGNHDKVYGNTNYNVYFPYEEQKNDNPYFGGAMKEGETDNLYYTFEVNGIKYMVITLGLYPNNSVLDWANSVVKAHADHNVIVTTHSYLRSQDTYDVIHTVEHEDPTYTGVNVWNRLIKCNPNIIMTLSAHNEYPYGLAGLGLKKDTNDAGNTVYQFLVGDPQVYDLKYGGTGSVTMLRFSEDGRQVTLEYICTREDKRLVVGTSNASHDTKNYITIDVEPVLPDQADTVTVSEWSAEDLLEAAKTTDAKNENGTAIYAPELREWRVGVQNVNPTKDDWMFTNSEQNLYPVSGGTDFEQVRAGDKLRMEIYAKVENNYTYDLAAGYLDLILHNNSKYSMQYAFDKVALEKAVPAPEMGEGVMKYTWEINDVSLFRQLDAGDSAGSVDEKNRLQVRCKVFKGASVEFYGYTLFNETQKSVLLASLTRKMMPNAEFEADSNYEPITRPGLVTYTGINGTLDEYTLSKGDRKNYNGGASSREALLINEMPLGRLYEGTNILQLTFASGYGLGNHRKFALIVKDKEGNVVMEEVVNRNTFHDRIGYGAFSNTFWLTDSGLLQIWNFPLELTAQQAGEEYSLSIRTYNDTDLALFGLKLNREAVWQDGLNSTVGSEEGDVVVKNWDYMSLAKLDGDYTSSKPNGNEPAIQYTTDTVADKEGMVPIGIEYYSDETAGVMINGDGTIEKIGLLENIAEITIDGVSFSSYQGQKLTVESKVFLTASSGTYSPWIRIYNGGNSLENSDKVSVKRVLDFSFNSGENELGYSYNNATLVTDATYGYPYKAIKGQGNAREGTVGFHNLYASVWLFANAYKYTPTNTYRVYDYTLKDSSGKVIFSLEGEDFIQIAEQQNAAREDGTYRRIKARVLWGHRADAFTVNGYKTVGGSNDGTFIKEAVYDHDLYTHSSQHTNCGYDATSKLLAGGATTTSGSARITDRVRLQFALLAPKGFNGRVLTFQLYYRKTDGTTGVAGSPFAIQSDASGNMTVKTALSGSSVESISAGTAGYNIPGVASKQCYVVYLPAVNDATLAASANGTLKEFYLTAKFDGGAYDFAAYPVYTSYIRFSLIRDHNVTNSDGTTSTHTCWLYDTTKNKEQISPNASTMTYGVAMEEFQSAADNAPSATPLSTRYAKDAVETKLNKGRTYSEVVSFTQEGYYEVSWEVSGPVGSTFTIAVDRNKKGSLYERTILSFAMDGTRKIRTMSFRVTDPTDLYTVRINSESGDTSLWKGEIRAQKAVLAGGMVYASPNRALEEVPAGSGVELLRDVSLLEKDSVAVSADTYLDLRGHTLTAKHLISFGQVLDSGCDRNPGGLALVDNAGKKITSEGGAALILQEDNKTMPLFDSALGGYRLFDYSFENAGTKASADGDKVTFGYFLKFDHADAYTLLANGQNGFAMDVNVRWTGSHIYHYHIAADTVKGFANAVKTKLDAGASLKEIRTAITLSIGGVNWLGQSDVLCTSPIIRSENTRVEVAVGEEVYRKVS